MTTNLARQAPPNLRQRSWLTRWRPRRSGLTSTPPSMGGRNARTVRAYQGDYQDFARFLGSTSAAEALDALVMQSPGSANAVALGYRTTWSNASSPRRRSPAGWPRCGSRREAGQVARSDRLDARRRVTEDDPVPRHSRALGCDGWRGRCGRSPNLPATGSRLDVTGQSSASCTIAG